MTRNLALAAAPLLLALAACGSDTKSCSTTGTPVLVTNSACTLRSNAPATVQLRATECQRCSVTSPSCDYDPATNHFDTQYQECTEDAGCGQACPNPAVPTFTCQFTTPAQSGSTQFFYNVGTTGAVNIQAVNITLDPASPNTSCTL